MRLLPNVAPLRLLAALVLSACVLPACTTDCEVICEKQLECAGLGGDEAQQQLCVEQCERNVEEDRRAEEAAACASCVEGKSCEELYPASGEGACDADC